MMEKPIKDQEQLELEEKIITEDLITEVAIPTDLATEVPLSVADGLIGIQMFTKPILLTRLFKQPEKEIGLFLFAKTK